MPISVPVSPASNPLTIVRSRLAVAVVPLVVPLPVKSAVKPPDVGGNKKVRTPLETVTVEPEMSTCALSVRLKAPKVVSIPEPLNVSSKDGGEPPLPVPETLPPKVIVDAFASWENATVANSAADICNISVFIECSPAAPRNTTMNLSSANREDK